MVTCRPSSCNTVYNVHLPRISERAYGSIWRKKERGLRNKKYLIRWTINTPHQTEKKASISSDFCYLIVYILDQPAPQRSIISLDGNR